MELLMPAASEIHLKPGSSRVVGGSEASEGEIPWQVAIETYDGIHYCGGSIVTERHFISAGHCVEYGD
jgi:chymotrypsin